MSAGAALVRFTAEFAVFLVAGACLAMILMRPGLLVSGGLARRVTGVAFALLAAAVFTSGAILVDEPDAPIVVAGRVLGVILLVALPLAWRGGSLGQFPAAGGVIVLGFAEVVDSVGEELAADWLRLAGALVVGAGCLLAARRSIPARIATSASAILLSVVLAVSIGLSAVISGNVEDEAERRLESRTTTEASLAGEAGEVAQVNADFLARALRSDEEAAQRLLDLAAAAEPDPIQLGQAEEDVRGFTEAVIRELDPRVGPVLVLGPAGQFLVRVNPDGVVADAAVEGGLAGSDAVAEARAIDGPVQSVIAAGDGAYGVGVSPVRVGDGSLTVAYVVVSSQLDPSYVEARLIQSGEDAGDLSYALASGTGVLATSGTVFAVSDLTDLTREVLAGADSATRLTSTALLVARPVRTPLGAPVLAFVSGQPIALIQQTRADLFQLLFLIALGATLLALVLTAVVGERIGAGLRRLTHAAGEVTSGNLLVSPGVRSDDELGVLSDAFDSMTGSLRGMTADLRKAADDEARLRTRLEAVVGGMGEALVAVNHQGDVTDFNAAAELLTGVPARKAIGRPASKIVRVVTEEGADLSSRLAKPVDESWASPATVLHATGVEVPVIISAGALRGASNESVGAVFVLRDVRREREVERMKSEFLANISHELRTPLSPIKGYSQILRRRRIPAAEIERFAGEIERGADKLERVVDQLVNFAAMSAGRFEVRTEPVVLRDVLDRVVARWSDRVEQDTFTISRRVARGVPKLWLDRRAIEQALDELIDNAIKYSPTGGRIDVTATLEPVARRKPAMVRLAVTDRGLGIPADRLDAVLEDFTQADGSMTRTFGGLGLGLTLVARIARAHGGDVELVSAEGKGTEVSMLLPAGEPESAR